MGYYSSISLGECVEGVGSQSTTGTTGIGIALQCIPTSKKRESTLTNSNADETVPSWANANVHTTSLLSHSMYFNNCRCQGKLLWEEDLDYWARKKSWFQINNTDHSRKKVTLNSKSESKSTELLPLSKTLGSFRLPYRAELECDSHNSDEQVTQEHKNVLKSS